MSEFTFKEIDQEGLETLKSISEANQFNEWMYDRISPFCDGKILEIGSGIGNISEYFVRDKKNIHLTDIRDNYLDFLKNSFENRVERIEKMDVVVDSFESDFKDDLGTYDAVFALNVVEHIEDDHKAISNIYKLLKPTGKIIILVPAYQFLYNSFDKALEHYRRYNRKNLSELIHGNGFDIVKCDHFNFAGMFGWFLSGHILKKETIPSGQMKLYNSLVPIFKVVDKVVMNKMGLSVVCVGEKPSN